MWDCQKCGVKAVAESVEACPGCKAARPEKDPGEGWTMTSLGLVMTPKSYRVPAPAKDKP